MKKLTKHIDKKHKLAHHPVDVAAIPHIVTVVTIAYMFSFFLLSVGFVVGYKNGVLQEGGEKLNTPIIEEIDTFPVYPDEEFSEYVEEMEMYFRDLEDTSVRIDSENVVLSESDVINSEQQEIYSSRGPALVDEYLEEYPDLENITQEFEDEVLEEPALYNEPYYDEDYSMYWEQDNTQSQELSQNPVDTVPASVQNQPSYINSFNTSLSSYSLLSIGMWVLAIGVLVYTVNHIHDTSNPHFTTQSAKKKKTKSKKSKNTKVKKSNAKK